MIDLWEQDLAAREARGEAKATRKAILLMAKRLRDVPDDFEAKLSSIDELDKLYRILEQLPYVQSVDELDLV